MVLISVPHKDFNAIQCLAFSWFSFDVLIFGSRPLNRSVAFFYIRSCNSVGGLLLRKTKCLSNTNH